MQALRTICICILIVATFAYFCRPYVRGDLHPHRCHLCLLRREHVHRHLRNVHRHNFLGVLRGQRAQRRHRREAVLHVCTPVDVHVKRRETLPAPHEEKNGKGAQGIRGERIDTRQSQCGCRAVHVLPAKAVLSTPERLSRLCTPVPAAVYAPVGQPANMHI